MSLAFCAAKYPLLVKVQTIDIHSLKFRTNGTFKPRHVTCVEASNLFIFVGVSSGTVYAFSRATLAFKFMIPFKGGKVCSISCAENERDIAIGSIRGQVSLYQLIEQSTHSKLPTHATPLAFFKYVHTIEHHKGNEITELHWSPNGRYLFTGDSQGLVSQADVGTWEEFPRPVSLSQVILKLKNRIMQIQFLFPYLAICTVSAVVLCDIENEDFTRIQFESKRDIHATGLALVLSDAESNLKSTIHLYVSEMTSGLLHCFNLRGHLIESKKIEMNSFLTQNPVPAFDPIFYEASPRKIADLTSSVTLGKLLLTDDNFLISVSNNYLYVIDPKKMELTLWNDEFNKIQSAKLLSNYAFLLSTTKVHVLSLTQVLPYSEQLFRSGVIEPFERWIQHCLHAIGWKENEENEDIENRVENHFRLLFHGDSENERRDKESDFYHFISERIPFSLSDPDEQTLTSNLWKPFFLKGKPLLKLLAAFDEVEVQDMDHPHQSWYTLWEPISNFYSGMNLNIILNSGSAMTLTDVMLNIDIFHKEMSRVNLHEELKVISMRNENQILEDRILSFLSLQQNLKTETQVRLTSQLCQSEDSGLTFFSSFVNQNIVREWFTDLEPITELPSDACWADLLLLLIPFLSPQKRAEIVTKCRLRVSRARFFTWLLTSTVYNFSQTFPYELQLKSLFSSKSPGFGHAKVILSSIYRDLVQADLRIFSTSLHHVISILFFTTPENDVELMEEGKPFGFSNKDTFLYLLFSCFPFKHWLKEDIELKITTLCQKSDALFRMFQAASLIFRRDLEYCTCGIPLNCSSSQPPPPTALTPEVTFIQNIVEEVVLEMLTHKYLAETHRHPLEGKDLLTSLPFTFSMQSKRFEQFLHDFSQELSETMLIEILLRVGSCALLELVGGRPRLETFLEKLDDAIFGGRCGGCGDELVRSQAFQPFSIDCIGIWVLKNCSSLAEFGKTVEGIGRLNTCGTFSLRFYQLLAEESSGKVSQGRSWCKVSCESFHA